MTRALRMAVAVGACLTLGLAGCSDESKVTHQETVKTPEGSTTTTIEKKVESRGDNPPANSEGATAKDPNATTPTTPK